MPRHESFSENKTRRFPGTYREWKNIREFKTTYFKIPTSTGGKYPLATKYLSWKRRNDSRQVSNVLNSKLFSQFPTPTNTLKSSKDKHKRIIIDLYSNSSSEDEMYSTDRKRVKRNPIIISNRSKLTQTPKMGQLKQPKPACGKCYCNTLRQADILHSATKSQNIMADSSDESPTVSIDNAPRLSAHKSSTISLKTLEHAREIIDYSPESTFLRRLRNEAKLLPTKFQCNANCSGVKDPEKFKQNIIADLEKTDTREQIDKVYEKHEKYHKKKYDPRCYEDDSEEPESDRRMMSPKYNKTRSHKQPVYTTNRKNKKADDETEINRIKDFRKSNFFDCYSTSTLTDKIDIPLHTCIHKYELDERLFPTPLYPDNEDRSRCIICDLPMVTAIDDFVKCPGFGLENYELEYMKKRRDLKDKLGADFTEQQIELKIPIKTENDDSVLVTSFSSGKSKLARKLKSNKQKFDVPLKTKKMVPVNSLALRYQKGVA